MQTLSPRVGVAAGTTTIRLGECLEPAFPVDTNPQPGAGAFTPTDPYGNEIELRAAAALGAGVLGTGRDLGLVLVPYGYKKGEPPWEVVEAGADPDRRGCDPQHYTKGEEGYYYDSSLGEDQASALYAAKAPAKKNLGRGQPTDAELSIYDGYRPVISGMYPSQNGQLIPLPWVPPNGWNAGGAFGPRPWPHPTYQDPRWAAYHNAQAAKRGLRDSTTDPTAGDSSVPPVDTTTSSTPPPGAIADQAAILAAQNALNEQQHRRRMFVLGVISTSASVAIAGSVVLSRVLRKRAGRR